MKIRNKILQFLLIYIGSAYMIASCNIRDQKQEIQTETDKPKQSISFNIYIENSGSMAGYCNYQDTSALETLIDDIYERFTSYEHVNNVTLNFINTSIEATNNDKRSFLKSIKNKCTAQYTKIDSMLKMMMDSVSDNNVNILISDYSFTTDNGNLAAAASTITGLFTKQLNSKEISVAIFKYMRSFKGRYYPGGISCNKPLPLYIWVFGNKESVREVTRMPFATGNCGTFFMQTPCVADYHLEAKRARMIKNNVIDASEWEPARNKDYYEFYFITTLSQVLPSEDDILEINNYIVKSSNSTNFKIKHIEKLKDKDKYKYHIITLNSNPSPGELKISYPIKTPQWVFSSTFLGNGIPNDSTTYGLHYLIDKGVFQAYKNKSNNNCNYIDITISII